MSTERELATVELRAQMAVVAAMRPVVAHMVATAEDYPVQRATHTLALRRYLTHRSPSAVLAGAVSDTLLSGNLLGRYHALSDALGTSFAQAPDVVPYSPDTWTVPRVVQTALDFLFDKEAMGAREYAALRDQYRSAGFHIAGVTERDALDVALNSLLRSAKAGRTVDEAAAALQRALRRAGFDPLRPWHARLVAQMNFASAYGAGSWEQLHARQLRGIIPAYRYVTAGDERVRPRHAAMEGFIAARTHPIWTVWWPPNGYNCRCRIVGVNAATWRARGEKSDPWPRVDAEGHEVASGGVAVRPDPGFAGNPSAYLRARAQEAA